MSITRCLINFIPSASKITQTAVNGTFLSPTIQSTLSTDHVRYRRMKHFLMKWRKLRQEKVFRVKLHDYHEKDKDVTEEERKEKMRKMGLKPIQPWSERPTYLSCTGASHEPYVPPEGDGKMSIVTVGGAKQKVTLLEKKSRSMLAVRKIKTYDEDFNVNEFGNIAQEIYIKAHECLANGDRYGIRQHITERCYPEMMYNSYNKTIHWKFLQSLEPPRVVHARHLSIISKDNLFAQVTVRFHTQQLLAVYDRFGRLMHGSEILAKDVLEYVIFEKHLSNIYGSWRIHDKIIPSWMPEKDPSPRTHNYNDFIYDFGEKEESATEEVKTAEENQTPPKDGGTPTPALATA